MLFVLFLSKVCGWNTSSNTVHSLISLGSNISFYYRAISSQFCGSEEIKKYTTYNKYLRIDFSRWIGGGSSYSGFVAGYIMFGKYCFFTLE